jgi:hypothetical protein
MTTQAMIETLTLRLPLLPASLVKAMYELSLYAPVWADAAPDGETQQRETLPLFLQSFGHEWDTPAEDLAWATL